MNRKINRPLESGRKVKQKHVVMGIAFVYFAILNIGVGRFLLKGNNLKIKSNMDKKSVKLGAELKHFKETKETKETKKFKQSRQTRQCDNQNIWDLFLYFEAENGDNFSEVKKNKYIVGKFFSIIRLFVWNFKRDKNDDRTPTVRVHLLLTSLTFTMQARNWCASLVETTQRRGVCDLVILENTNTNSVLEFAKVETKSNTIKQNMDLCVSGVILINQVAVQLLGTEKQHFTNQQLSVIMYDDFLKLDKTKISCFLLHRALKPHISNVTINDKKSLEYAANELSDVFETLNMCSAYLIPTQILSANSCSSGLYWNAGKSGMSSNPYWENKFQDCSPSYSASSSISFETSEYCCEVCPSGTYRTNTLLYTSYPPLSDCEPCYYGKFKTHDTCTENCNAYAYSDCDACTGNTYADTVGQSSCKNCPGQNMRGNGFRCSCNEGYGFTDSGIFNLKTFRCDLCESGKVATDITSGIYWPIFIHVGRADFMGGVEETHKGWTEGIGDYKCLPTTIPKCENHHFYDMVNDGCKPCPENQYRLYAEGNTAGEYSCLQATQCDAGEKFDRNNPGCVDCEAGKYRGDSGSIGNYMMECIDCPPNYYSSSGAMECIQCEPGKFQIYSGKTSCSEKCFPGFFLDGDSCEKCKEDNTFTPEPNVFTECLKCPSGTRSFYNEADAPSGGDLLTQCQDCEACPAAKYRTGCSGNQNGKCEDCLKCPEGEINVGCRWTRSQNEQSGLCFPEELVVRTPTCPDTGKSDESSSGLGGFSFKSLFGLDETEVNFQCSNPCVGTPTKDSGFCDGPHPCNIRACSMTASADILNFEDKDGVAGQTFRQARACPVEFDENELQGTDFLEFQNFTRINQKRKIKCQTCLECGSSGSDDNAQNVNNYGRGCAHECTILLCEVGEIWDWTQKQCVHCDELEDVRLCLSQEVNLKARDISGNRPRILVGGDSCTEKPAATHFASDFRASYGTCAECATRTCPDSLFHASCREDHCQDCLPHTTPNIHIPLHTQEFLDGSFQRKPVFCQFWGCEAGKTGVKNNGELCSGTCADNACSEFDIQLNCVLPHLSNRCVPNIASSQHKRGMLSESFVLRLQTNILEPLGIDSHLMHSSFENAIIVLSDESSEDNLFQCVWNSIDIKDNFYDAAGISNTFFPRTSALADQLSERGSKHCHERTPDSSITYASLPLQNVVSFDNYDHHRILLDNPARVMAWDRYSGRSDCVVDCPENIDPSALKKPPDATNRGLTGAYLGDLFLAMHMKNSKTSSVLIPLPQTRMSTMSWVSRWQFSFWASVLTAANDDVFVNIEQGYETTLRKKMSGLNFTLNGRLSESSTDNAFNIKLSDYMNSSETMPFPALSPQKIYCSDSVVQFNFKHTEFPLKVFTSQKSQLAGEHDIKVFPRDLYEISMAKCHSTNVDGIESPDDIIAFKRLLKVDLGDTPSTNQRVLVVNKNYVSIYTLNQNLVDNSSKLYSFTPQMKKIITDAQVLHIFAGGDTFNAFSKFVFLYATRLTQTSGNVLVSPFLRVKFLHTTFENLQSHSHIIEVGFSDGTVILPRCAACVEEYGLPVIVAFSSLSTEVSSAFLQLLTPEVVLREDWPAVNSNWQVLLQLRNIELDAAQNFAIIVRDVTELSIVYDKEWSLIHSLHRIEAVNFIFDANSNNVTDDTFNSNFRESNSLWVVSVLCPIELRAFCTLHATFVSYSATPGKKSMTTKEKIFIELRQNRYDSMTTVSTPDQSLVINVRSNSNERIYLVRNVKNPIFQEVFDSIFHDKSVFTILDDTYITLNTSSDTSQVSVVGKLEGFSANSNIGVCVATEFELVFTTSAVPYYQQYETSGNFVFINSSDVLDLVYSSKNGEDLIKTPSYINLDQNPLHDYEICFENKFSTKFRYLNFLLGSDSGLRFTCSDCFLTDTIPRDNLNLLTFSEKAIVADKYPTSNEQFSNCPENYFRQIEIAQSSVWIPSLFICENWIECPHTSDEFPSWIEYTNACRDVCDKSYGFFEGNLKEGYVYCHGLYMDESSQRFRICSSQLTITPQGDPVANVRSPLPESYCHTCPADEQSPAGSSHISDCDCKNHHTRNAEGKCEYNFIVKENEYIQIRFEQNSTLVEYLVYEKQNSEQSTQDVIKQHSLQASTVLVDETEKVCLVGDVTITDMYELDDQMFGVSGWVGADLYPYSTEHVKVSAEWKPYAWVGSHKYESGNQFMKLTFDRKSDTLRQDLTQDVTVGIDGLQLLPLFNFPHTSSSRDNSVFAFVQIPTKQELVLSGIAEIMSGNNIENWGKIFTSIQIVGTTCTYRIKIVPVDENSFLKPSSAGSAIDEMGCTLLSPGFCQLEIPTQILNSHLQIAVMATSVGNTNNSLCYIQDHTDETFDASGHQFSVTVLPLQRIYQCDGNHFWSETTQTCKSCTDHDVVCPVGEYIEGCDLLGRNITCQPCPQPQDTKSASFTWGENCEINCQEGYYKTGDENSVCLKCTTDLEVTCSKTPGLKWQACSAYSNEKCVPCEPIAIGLYGAYETFTNTSECATTCIDGTFRDTDSCVPCSSHEDVISKAKLTIDPKAYYRTLPCTESSNTLAESCNSEKLTKNGTYVSDAPAAHIADNGLANDCLIDCPDGWHRVPKTYTRDLNSEKVPVAQWSGYDCVLCDTFDSSGVKLPQYSFTVDFECELTCNHSAHYYLRGENMTIMGSVSSKRTCSYCNTASCAIGTYMTGEYSEPCECRNCTLKYPGLIFSSEGKILDDISSCRQQCPHGFFGNDYMRVCIPWTPLICDSEFYFQQGTSATDAICLPCTKCHDSLLVSNCTNTSDSVCIACPNASPGSIYENSNCTLKCMDGYILNQETQICESCLSFQCPAGFTRSTNPQNCSHCIHCQNILPPNSSYTSECTWKCNSGYVYHIEKHRCIQYNNQLQYPSTISQKSSISCPYDHYLRFDFSCDLCENYPNQHPSNLKPENTSTWSWVFSLQPCSWDCKPPLLYFVHIASYGHGHASPKCYTSEEIGEILNAQENSKIVISEQNFSFVKSNPRTDVMSPILFSFFIIFAIFLFIFAFFYPLLISKPDHLDHPHIEDAEAPKSIPDQVTTEEDE